MNLYRILAIVKRHLYHNKRSWDRISEAVYWPVMDLILWGMSTLWLQRQAQQPGLFVLIMLTAVVYWQIVWRANQEVSLNLLEETWSRNVVNLFATPLTIAEWIIGVMLVGIVKVALAIVVGFSASWILFQLNLLKVGHLLLPFLVGLILFGWTLGLVSAAFILRYGRRVQALSWMTGALFAPLSGVYYPVSALPSWIQPCAYFIPTTYIFEGMRTVMEQQIIDYRLLAASFGINLIYLGGALLFFSCMFEGRRMRGLQGLE